MRDEKNRNCMVSVPACVPFGVSVSMVPASSSTSISATRGGGGCSSVTSPCRGEMLPGFG